MNIAFFDFDGTITFEDTFSRFLKQILPKRRFIRGYLFLAPWIVGYRLGLVAGTHVRKKVVNFAYKGQHAALLKNMGAAYAHEVLPSLVRNEAQQRIQWHLDQGDKVVVVSASLDFYLAPWCRKLGLELICSSLESKGGILTGKYVGNDCTGEEKKTRVLNAFDLKQYNKVYAYGDTKEDNELLGLADIAFFRWKPMVHKHHENRPLVKM